MAGSLIACCATATDGDATTAPPTTLMKSRRRIASPNSQNYAEDAFRLVRLQQAFETCEMG